MHPSEIKRQKSRAAEIYKDCYEGIIKRILGGKLIHADETKISVGGRSAFVWVITNLDEVAYLYSETREGEMIQSLMRDFHGVLVSDFYSAYDAIECPQQKCLIHLIRDMNDDLYKRPFDHEFKKLVNDFATMLRKMVETIDRFGLKAYHLRKHKIEVAQFYKSFARTNIKVRQQKGIGSGLRNTGTSSSRFSITMGCPGTITMLSTPSSLSPGFAG